jgi:hypothetical protein
MAIANILEEVNLIFAGKQRRSDRMDGCVALVPQPGSALLFSSGQWTK